MFIIGKFYKTTIPFFLYDDRNTNSIIGERRIEANSVVLFLEKINDYKHTELKVLYEGRLGYLSPDIDVGILESYFELCK